MKYYTALLFIIFTTQILAQNFNGKIVNKNGEPIYGSTIYIREKNQGIVCNEEGYFQVALQSGKYNIEYKCLGYKTLEQNIVIYPNKGNTVEIILEESPYILDEVIVSKTEDPAYKIMRNAIKKAPYYADIISKYKAEAYIKGSLEMLSISGLADRMIQKTDKIKMSDLKDHIFVQETFNEIEFTAPDKYKQTVKAFSSSIPDNFDSKESFSIISGSLYRPKLGKFISPLNKAAFSYYNFKYEGYLEENNLIINKIRVSPKIKDAILFDGYIYIADVSYHLYSSELETNTIGVKSIYKISYEQIETDAFLPTTFYIKSEINILGINALANYYTSIKYSEIILNSEFAKEQIFSKKKQNKLRFEIPLRDSLYMVIADSMAKKRDVTYWENIRSIPLESKERKSLINKDSIQYRIDSVRKIDDNQNFSLTKLLIGSKTGTDSSKIRFRYDGLLKILPEYNFIDGAWLGQKIGIKTKFNRGKSLGISPYLYYATARKKIIGGTDINFSYAPLKLGKLNISIGSVTSDFNPLGTKRFDNMCASLVTGHNRSFLFQNNYISITNKIDLANGLNINTGIEIAKRSGLANNTDFTLWGTTKKIKPNIFAMDRFDKTAYFIQLEYSPYAYYKIKDGKKEYEYYSSPTFTVGYKEAFSSWQINNSRYRQASINIKQDLQVSYFSKLEYYIGGGVFLGNRDEIHFADYHHFDMTNVVYSSKSPFKSFLLSDSYQFSTNKYWFDLKINYTSKYLLIKRLPFLQGKIFNESIHIKSLYSPNKDLYSEAGYSLNLTKYICAGMYTSFNNVKFNSCNFRLSIDVKIIKSIID